MGQWSGGSLGSPYSRGSSAPAAADTSTPASAPSPPTSYALAPAPAPAVGGSHGLRLIQLAAALVAVLLLAAVIGLTIVYVGAKSKLGSTRSALAASRAQLLSVQVALAGDMKALQTEQAVGTYMRGVRDALAPALAAYSASGSASSASAARANDEEAIAALTSARQKVSALVLPDSLRSADGDIRAAMEALAGGLQSEVTAIGSGNLGGLDAALTLEGQALEHLQTALGEMYSAVGTAGPASGTS
ncbi:MAG: hypothetical protein QOG36_276 [Actinomycetota bacterium]|nr:hypothetical protein [Actinomycetota bacterium]